MIIESNRSSHLPPIAFSKRTCTMSGLEREDASGSEDEVFVRIGKAHLTTVAKALTHDVPLTRSFTMLRSLWQPLPHRKKCPRLGQIALQCLMRSMCGPKDLLFLRSGNCMCFACFCRAIRETQRAIDLIMQNRPNEAKELMRSMAEVCTATIRKRLLLCKEGRTVCQPVLSLSDTVYHRSRYRLQAVDKRGRGNEKYSMSAQTSMYHSLGYATILWIQAVMTFERSAVDEAVVALKHCSTICNARRRKTGFLKSLVWLQNCL